MNKHQTRAVLLVVLLPVAIVITYMTLSYWNEFRKFQQFYIDASKVIQEISLIERKTDGGDLKQEVDEWNKKANGKLNSFCASYENSKSKEIVDSVAYTRALFRVAFGLRLNFADAVDPLYSERMQDHATIRDQAEYEWRMQTLETINQYVQNYENSLVEAIDIFRQSIVTNNWSDQYREYAWQEWGRDIKPQLAKLLPASLEAEAEITKFQRFFSYMYKYKDVYYINEKGDFIFSHQRYLTDALGVINSMGSKWSRYSVVNPF